jgi:hypothetical protein
VLANLLDRERRVWIDKKGRDSFLAELSRQPIHLRHVAVRDRTVRGHEEENDRLRSAGQEIDALAVERGPHERPFGAVAARNNEQQEC